MNVEIFQVGIKAVIRNQRGEVLLVKIPEWSGNPAHWDMPGGRVDKGEDFEKTLKRELKEELNWNYTGSPKQLISFITSITIPVEGTRVPLVFVTYEVEMPEGTNIQLNPDSPEEEYRWFNSKDAAKELVFKCSKEFCNFIANMGPKT